MKEFLKIAPNGQWTLMQKQDHKSDTDQRDPEYADDPKYKSYRDKDLQGQLKEDHGRKGLVHNTGNKRPSRQMSDNRMNAKVPTILEGVSQENKPGGGIY